MLGVPVAPQLPERSLGNWNPISEVASIFGGPSTQQGENYSEGVAGMGGVLTLSAGAKKDVCVCVGLGLGLGLGLVCVCV